MRSYGFLLSAAVALLGTTGGAFAAAASRPWTDAYRSFNREFGATQQFANMGVKTRAFFVGHTKNSVGQPYCEYAPVWCGEKDYDWRQYDRQIGDLLMTVPDADFVVLVDLNTPEWLRRRFRLDSFDAVDLAVSDREWFRITSEWLRDFVAYSEGKYGSRIRAYALMCGSTDEWYGAPGWGFRSAAQDDRWCEWRAARGLAPADIPCLAAQTNAAFEGVFYDPRTEQVKIDYNRFRDESVADGIIRFAKVAKDAMPGAKKEVGAFYGYYYLSMNCHMAYDRLFDAPEIDFAIAPATYWDRQVGGGAGSLLVDGSLARRGKRFVHEIDCRPHDMVNPPYFRGVFCSYCRNDADHVAINLREGCHALIRHGSWWWFDQWGGYYKTPETLKAIERFSAAARRFRDDASPSAADILYVADPESVYRTTAWKTHCSPGTPHRFLDFGEGVRNVFNRTGCVTDWYSWSDLGHIDLSKYRAVVFPGLFLITPEREKFLREKILTGGRTVFWYGAPGITDGKTLDVARVEKFAGAPYGSTGMKVTKRDGWTDVFFGHYPKMDKAGSVDDLRKLLTDAGCHAWTDECLPVDANARLVSVHCATGGAKTIRLPRQCAEVVDLLTGRTVGRNCREVTVEFATPDTKLFELK